ncbi:MAG: hypothetical protein JWR50_204 [Mucilaginibacter sp.]|nr:hypothetical protein [Mucilaginibacter sp.]
MKILYTTIVAVMAIVQFSYAQFSRSGSHTYLTNINDSLGIGTSTPAAKIDVYGSIAVNGSVVSSSQNMSVPSDGTYVVASGTRIKGTYSLTFDEGFNRIQAVVLLVNANHNDSGSSLSVLSNNSYANAFVMSNFRIIFNSDYSTVYLVFDATNRNGGSVVTAHFDGIGYWVGPNWGGTLPASPLPGGVYPLTVNAGKVGIGTTVPDQMLTVNGTIHSKEVKVDLSIPGPDYVFDNDYKLTTLPELRGYLTKNHHLPEIPSAAQMAKDGLNLGDMNIKLLKTVEELTLYLIEKDNQLTNQKTKSERQDARIAALEKALAKLTAIK